MDRGNQNGLNQPDNRLEDNDNGSTSELEYTEPIGTTNGSVETDKRPIAEPSEAAEPTQPQKRGRGRPRKQSNPTTTESGETTFSISEKRKVSKRPTKVDERKLYTPDEAQATAKIILGMVQAIGMSIAGDEAVFNQMEDTLLSSSLPPLLERMSVTSAEKTANVLYPLCIGFASVSYAIRLYNIQKAKTNTVSDGIQVPEYEDSITTDLHQNGKTQPSLNPFMKGRGIN